MAGFEEEGIDLVGERRGGEREREFESLVVEVLGCEVFDGGERMKIGVERENSPHALWFAY